MTTTAVYNQHVQYAPVDRAALRLGLALVTWSRRARRTVSTDHAEQSRLIQQARMERERELAASHLVYLGMR